MSLIIDKIKFNLNNSVGLTDEEKKIRRVLELCSKNEISIEDFQDIDETILNKALEELEKPSSKIINDLIVQEYAKDNLITAENIVTTSIYRLL